MAETKTVFPKRTNEILTNPGVGFNIARNLGLANKDVRTTKGMRVDKYKFSEDAKFWNYPKSKFEYFRAFYWRNIEAKRGEYDFSIIDNRLAKNAADGITTILRFQPYALSVDSEIPDWLREMYPEDPEYFFFWRIDPNKTDYAKYYAEYIRALGKHLDGNPAIESIDLTIAGAWGEGGGTEFMESDKRAIIIEAFLESFKKTPLQFMLHSPDITAQLMSYNRPLGFRVDCLGDMGGFHGEQWAHMLDMYPQMIGNCGVDENWKTGSIIFEACWVMADWFAHDWDIDYIIDESLKWHISSYNSKATTVPEEWKPNVERWLRKMGYQYEARRISFDDEITAGGKFRTESHWVNDGVAPCYHAHPLTYRLTGNGKTYDFVSTTDIRKWLPGDWMQNDVFDVPQDIKPGTYELAVGIVHDLPTIKTLEVRMEGRREDGFYPVSTIVVK